MRIGLRPGKHGDAGNNLSLRGDPCPKQSRERRADRFAQGQLAMTHYPPESASFSLDSGLWTLDRELRIEN